MKEMATALMTCIPTGICAVSIYGLVGTRWCTVRPLDSLHPRPAAWLGLQDRTLLILSNVRSTACFIYSRYNLFCKPPRC